MIDDAEFHPLVDGTIARFGQGRAETSTGVR